MTYADAIYYAAIMFSCSWILISYMKYKAAKYAESKKLDKMERLNSSIQYLTYAVKELQAELKVNPMLTWHTFGNGSSVGVDGGDNKKKRGK